MFYYTKFFLYQIQISNQSLQQIWQLIERQMKEQKRWVLILGGTNFMGKILLDQITTKYRVCCINRGKVYWNNQARDQHPDIEWFCSDRNQHQDYQSTVRFAGRHLGINQNHKWLAVVDFCGFNWRDVQSSLKGLDKNCEKYIFISTDSIYNNMLQDSKEPITEQQYDIQKEYKKIKKLITEGIQKIDLDKYGYNKLKCEIYLKRKSTIPYVCLRLPDVIGAYDNTNRLWATIKWIQESEKFNIPICSEDQNLKLSFVDAESVSNMISKLISNRIQVSGNYNLCSWQTCTNFELMQTIRKNIKIEAKYKAIPNRSKLFYPSVSCGQISCNKATKELGWQPLPLGIAIQRSVDFFLSKGNKYIEQRKATEKSLRRKVQKLNDQ